MKVFIETETLAVYPEGIPVYILNILNRLKRQYPDELDFYTLLGCWYRKYNSRLKTALDLIEPDTLKISRNWLPRPSFKYLPGDLSRFLIYPVIPATDLYHATANVISPNMPKNYNKLVLSVMDIVFLECAGRGYNRPEWESYMSRKLSESMEKVDVVITISEFTKNELCRYFKFPEERIIVTHLASQWGNIVEQGNDAADKEYLAGRGLAKDKYFISVGTISPRKNFQTLMTVYQEFNKKNPGSRLVIVGKNGWCSEKIMRQIEELKDIVVWIPSVSEDELKLLYRNARALFMISYYEGFGLPLIEAMQCGCPVCYASGSSLEEVSGSAGLMVKPDDRDGILSNMQSLWDDSDLCYKLRCNGLRRADDFSWEKTAEGTFQAYKLAMSLRD